MGQDGVTRCHAVAGEAELKRQPGGQQMEQCGCGGGSGDVNRLPQLHLLRCLLLVQEAPRQGGLSAPLAWPDLPGVEACASPPFDSAAGTLLPVQHLQGG